MTVYKTLVQTRTKSPLQQPAIVTPTPHLVHLRFQFPTSDLQVGTVSHHGSSVKTTKLGNIPTRKLGKNLTHPPDDLRRLEGHFQRPVLDLHVLAGTLVACFDPIEQNVSIRMGG